MTIFWHDFEILQLIDACHQGERGGIHSGIDLAQTLATDRGVPLSNEDYASLIRELFALHDAGLLTWQVMSSIGRVREISPNDPNDYLNNIREFALTINGRDRARGQVIYVSTPDSDEDDGRPIASLTLEDVAKCIGRKYEPHQAVQLLMESCISFKDDPANESETWEKLFVIFVELDTGVSGQRRELRRFIGAWLDDELRIGPSDQEHKRITADLARQGWYAKDGCLVIGEPERKRRDAAPPSPALDQLHPKVWEAAAPQWKVKHLHDAVMDASKAVNALLQAKVGRDDVSEVKLVQPSFSSSLPTTSEPRLRFPDIKDQQTRDSVTAGVLQFGVGCFMAIRNPIGHLPHEHHAISEQQALEQLAAWSQFARWIDRATVVSDED